MLRSAAAVVGGFIAYAFLMGFTVLVLQTIMPGTFGPGIDTPRALWVMTIEMVYSAAYAVFGGYVTGLIARRAEVGHAAILAGVILLIGAGSLLIPAQSIRPEWYATLLLVLSALSAVFGGYLRARQTTPVIA